MPEPVFREAVIDLGAIAANVRALRALVGTEHLIAVVKANAYGHGAVAAARAALAGGADWLGTADIAEALELREAGIEAPILAWLHAPGETFATAIDAGIDVGLSSLDQLEQVARTAGAARRPARVQLKLDTGLSRNGFPRADWESALARAAELGLGREVDVVGLFTHVSNATIEDDSEALRRFDEGIALARELGIEPDLVHAAASAAAIRQPESRYTAVRLGISIYGLSPFPAQASAADLGLRPAMTLRGRVAAVKRVAAGTRVSYDYTYECEKDTTLALVPLGYAEGVPRAASNRARVAIAGATHPVAGRIAMDQFVVDVGDAPVAVGDEVVLFGDGALGVPTAEDWAEAAGTINYEIVTRVGGRVARSYRGLEP
ncbi:alanine racemase [Gryllotalpicola sp.]|uniref:alanine racemase n=1 Tax=Gryllotalpicola sp. TaxID=1932787 RepID=UPI00260E16DA|nr:alanine racemase [Gryllotalpicola sp.]